MRKLSMNLNQIFISATVVLTTLVITINWAVLNNDQKNILGVEMDFTSRINKGIHLGWEMSSRKAPPAASIVTTDDIQHQDGFSICLLVKDDSDRLAEWLAYHWLTLPLQHLVVALDRTSVTSPKPILDMWREETGMDITLWNDPDFRHVQGHDDKLTPKQKHLHRQRQFLAECMRHHKAKNHSWIALIDTDEFIANNDGYYGKKDKGTPPHLPILRADQTLFDYLTTNQNNTQSRTIVDEKCHLMPRLVFSAVEDDPKIVQKAKAEGVDVDPMQFSTLRFYHHADPKNQAINKYGKVVINLDKIQWSEIHRKLRSVHRPLLKSCGFPYHDYSDAALTVHHYVGTIEQYFAKNVTGRTKKTFQNRAYHNDGKNYQMHDWLKRFVEKVGEDKSAKLLRTVGIIDHGKKIMLVDRPDYPKDRTDGLEMKVPETLRYFDENGNIVRIQGISSGISILEPTPVAMKANDYLRTNGVLLRVPKRKEYEQYINTRYLPASFVHASMRTPNVLFRPDETHVASVGVLFGSTFKWNLSSPLRDSVDCRAYYPSDAHSLERNHSLTNPLGSSCLSYQSTYDIQINGTGPLMYNRMKGCACNYEDAPGRDHAKYVIDNQQKELGRNQMNCWYPDTNAGINELVAASNSLYLNRMMLAPRPRVERFTRGNGMKNITYYQGWTECSASPDVQDSKMIDAVIIELPLVYGTNEMMPSIEDLDEDKLLDLKTKLENFEDLRLPVLVLEQKKGMIDEDECASLWEGRLCGDGYRKEFVPHTFTFKDGSCLIIAPEDEEVRFYSANSTRVNCTPKVIDEKHEDSLRMHNILQEDLAATPLWKS